MGEKEGKFFSTNDNNNNSNRAFLLCSCLQNTHTDWTVKSVEAVYA